MAKKTSRWRGRSSRGPIVRAPEKVSRSFRIVNDLGLHARAAAQFVKIAGRFHAEIEVAKDSRKVNGKSIMGILMLAAAKGSTIQVTAEGEDAPEAVKTLGALIQSRFGEK